MGGRLRGTSGKNAECSTKREDRKALPGETMNGIYHVNRPHCANAHEYGVFKVGGSFHDFRVTLIHPNLVLIHPSRGLQLPVQPHRGVRQIRDTSGQFRIRDAIVPKRIAGRINEPRNNQTTKIEHQTIRE